MGNQKHAASYSSVEYGKGIFIARCVTGYKLLGFSLLSEFYVMCFSSLEPVEYLDFYSWAWSLLDDFISTAKKYTL